MSLTVFVLSGVPSYGVTGGAISIFFSRFHITVFLASVVNFHSTLSNALVGYLHLQSAFLSCCNSLLSNSGLVQTVLALRVRVLITLHLTASLWWLSHCKY